MRPLHVLAAASLVWLTGCSGEKPNRPASTAPEPAVVYSANGWSDTERAEYYHLPEGSELMPYALLANLSSVKTGRPFLEGMDRFGFLPDNAGPTNPYGMPIGLTVSLSRNTLSKGRQMVGFNCAACHTGQIAYRGKHLRIDGAPALIDLQGYQMDFKASLEAALKDPKKLLALLVALGRDQKAQPPPAAPRSSR